MASSSGRGGSTVSAVAGREGGCRQRWPVRRLWMRKQSHLDDLTSQVAHLRRDNAHVAAALNLTTQGLLAVDAENAVLHTQAAELAARLASLNDILCSHRLTTEAAMFHVFSVSLN
uniref:BZIP domain-containing protein n=1 Tax=Oryza barthii TaxID=65489 RepID=A0A0D3GDQ3_9ORYZ